MRLRLTLTLLASFLLLHPQPAHCQVEYDSSLPFTWLFDTRSPSPSPLTAKTLGEKDGWKLIGEDDLEHSFKGDAVLLNDRLAVVLRAKGPGAEVYSVRDGRFLNRAVLAAVPDATTAVTVTGMTSIEIVDNSPGAVTVEAVFATSVPGGRSSATFGITTGQRMVEMCPKSGADRIFAWYRPRWIVVPDFFGHDMVFDPETVDSRRFGLPAENFFLGLVRGGDAMLMCVWKSGRRRSFLIPPVEGHDETVAGCEIDGAVDEPVWVAFFEDAGLWHQETQAVDGGSGPVSLDFEPPFEGRWRADLARPDGVAHSSPFSDGTVSVAGAEDTGPLPVIVYPLDRTRTTPLSAFCPTDVIRNALGVGPCKYVLQTEGLAGQTDSTPDQVMTWVERQFKRDRADEATDEIKELLAEMVELVEHAQERIDRYAEFAEEVAGLLERSQGRLAGLVQTAERLERVVVRSQSGDIVQRTAALAEEVVVLIGKPDSLGECQRLGVELRRIGASQDSALSQSRMIVRWLEVQAATLAAEVPESAESSRKVCKACQRQLENR